MEAPPPLLVTMVTIMVEMHSRPVGQSSAAQSWLTNRLQRSGFRTWIQDLDSGPGFRTWIQDRGSLELRGPAVHSGATEPLWTSSVLLG